MFRSITPSSPIFIRRLSFNFFKGRNKCCEKQDISADPPPKYIIQKACGPSIFEAWKPKIPDLNATKLADIRTDMMMPYKHKTCSAGMKLREHSRCELDAMARECERMNHPKWIRHCPPIPKKEVSEAKSILKAAEAKCKGSGGAKQSKMPQGPGKKSLRKKCEPEVPEADWNIDGHL